MLVFLNQPQNWIHPVPSLPQEHSHRCPAWYLLAMILFPFVVLCNHLFSVVLFFSPFTLQRLCWGQMNACTSWMTGIPSQELAVTVPLDVAGVKCSELLKATIEKFCWEEPLEVTWPNTSGSADVVTWTPLGCLGLKRTCSREWRSDL